MTTLNYYTEKKKRVTIYSRFRSEERTEKVTMVNFGKFCMELQEVKRHMYNERIGNWKMLDKTKSEKKIKTELEKNYTDFIKTF